MARSRDLTGVDYFCLIQDDAILRAGRPGFTCQIVLLLDGRLDPAALEARLEALGGAFPLLSARLDRRPFFGRPRWLVPDQPAGRPTGVSFTHRGLEADWPAGCELPGWIVEQFEAPHPAVEGPLARLVLAWLPDGRSVLSWSWNHLVADALGMEQLLAWMADAGAAPPSPEPAELALTDWSELRRQGQNARRVSGFFEELQRGPVQTLRPLGDRTGPDRIASLQLDLEQTAALDAEALRHGATGSATAYLAGVSVLALHQLALARGEALGSYLIPMTLGLRKKGEPGPDMANRFGFVFFQLDPVEIPDLRGLITQVRRQMKQQVREETSEAFTDAMTLSRRLPTAWVSRLTNRSKHGQFASFFIGNTGEGMTLPGKFLEVPVANLLHFARLPAPPGLTFIFNRFAGRQNATIVAPAALWTEAEWEALTQAVRAGLVGSAR